MSDSPEETVREALAWLDFAADSDNLGDADRKRLARQKPDALEALTSLRQRQEELEQERNEFYAEASEAVNQWTGRFYALEQESERELASLRTQLQQAEQRADGTCSKHDDRCHDRVSEVRDERARHIILNARAALAAPPADPPKERHYRPEDFDPITGKSQHPADPPTSSQEKP